MARLEAELDRARDLDVGSLADAIESIGFECTRCGECCTGYAPDEPGGAPAGEGLGERSASDEGVRERPTTVGNAGGDGGDGTGRDGVADGRAVDDAAQGTVDDAKTVDRGPEKFQSGGSGADGHEPHTATLFPDEARDLVTAASDRFDEAYDWRDVARPMPYGLSENADGDTVGETFEWAIAVDGCGDCTFYEESAGTGFCTVHEARPLICRTYPFSVRLDGTSQPMGEAVDEAGLVRAHECEGLGRDIERADAESLAEALKERTVRDLEEAIAVRDGYDPSILSATDSAIVVFDSEGPKRPDGTDIGSDDP